MSRADFLQFLAEPIAHLLPGRPPPSGPGVERLFRQFQDEAALQPFEVLPRVVQPVGVVDAQAVDLALAEQAEDQVVRGVEDFLPLHAQRRQLVDVEKAAVVDLVGGHAPERQAVGLGVEQPVQQVEARGVALLAVEQGNVPLDKFADRPALRGQGGEAPFDDLLLALPLDDLRRVGFRSTRQVADGVEDA